MYLTKQYPSPLGILTLAAQDDRLVGLWMDGQKYFGSRLSGLEPGESPALEQAAQWLDRYFAGETPNPRELPLSPIGTAFQKLVWALLLEIPYGQSTTYGALAKQVAAQTDRPSMSAQAVGSAVGHNPLCIIIPCHRVLGSTGQLTGYAGGLERKKALLELENIHYI